MRRRARAVVQYIPVSWAVALEGRSDIAAVLLLLGDKDEAVSIADEMRGHGHHVVVRAHPDRGPAHPQQATIALSPGR
jgi:hypothetical protein